MDTKRWNSLLVEWVNCLNLGKKIQNVEDLRNGEFFLNVQKLITKRSDVHEDILSFIIKLLLERYPSHRIENESEVHLQDLTKHDLLMITSLLMHYTCIYDRRDVLISPLCHSLSQSTQVLIREFLEKMSQSGPTSHSLDEIVNQCLTNEFNKDSANNGNAGGGLMAASGCSSSDDSRHSSPLLNLLKTPVSKLHRFQEKDRIITRLRSELENERYEKIDVQEELRLLNDKYQKTEKLLAHKKSEISRLKSEVASLEEKASPHDRNMEALQQQQRLKNEIQHLEQYIQQCEDEFCQVKEEKNVLKEKLRTVESQCVMWQEKYFEMERNLETLNDHSHKQEFQLKSLQEHCTELSALLDEYRNSKGCSLNNSTLEISESFSGKNKTLESTASCENLACTVVEVQLQDCHKLNDELKIRIKEMEDHAVKLMDEAGNAAKKLSESEEAFKKLQTEYEETVQEMENLRFNYTISRQKNSDNDELITKLNQRLHQRELEAINSNLHCDKLNNAIEYLGKKLDNLEKSNIDLLDALDKNEKMSDMLDATCSVLRTELSTTNQKLCAAEDKNQDLSVRLKEKQELCKKFAHKINDIQEFMEQQNEKHFLETEALRTECDLHRRNLLNVTKDLTLSKEAVKLEIDKYEELYADYTLVSSTVKDVEDENISLTNELCESKRIIENLTDSLKISEQNCALIAQENKEFLNKIKALEEKVDSNVKELGETKALLEKVRGVCDILKTEKCDLQISSERFTEEIQKLNTMLEEKEECLQIVAKNNTGFLSKISHLETELTIKTKVLEQTETNLAQTQDELEKCRNRCQSLASANVDLVESKENLETSLKESSEECENLKSEKAVLELNLNELTQRNRVLEEVVKENENQIEEIENDKKRAETKIQSLETDLAKSTESLEILRDNLDETTKILNKCQTDYEDHIASHGSLMKLHDETKTILEEVTKERDVLGSEKLILETTLNELNQENLDLKTALETNGKRCVSLESDKRDLQLKVLALEEEINVYKTKLDETQTALTKMQAELQQRQNEFGTLLEANKDLFETHQLTENELDQTIQERDMLKEKNLELQNTSKALVEKSQDLHSVIVSMEEEKGQLMLHIHILEEKIEVCVKELDETKINLSQTQAALKQCQNECRKIVDSNAQLLKLHEDTKKRLSEVTHERDALNKKYSELQVSSDDLVEECQNLTTNLEERNKYCQSIEVEVQQLTSEVNAQKKKMKIHAEEVNEMKSGLVQAQTALEQCQDHYRNLSSLNDKLQKSHRNMETLLIEITQERDMLKEKNIELQTTSDNLVEKCQHLQCTVEEKTMHCQNLEDEASQLTSQIDALKEEVNVHMKGLNEIRTNRERTQIELQQSRNDYQTLVASNEELSESEKSTKARLNEILQEYEASKLHNTELQVTSNDLIGKCQKLESTLRGKEKYCENLENEKDQLISQISANEINQKGLITQIHKTEAELLDEIQTKSEAIKAHESEKSAILQQLRAAEEKSSKLETDFENLKLKFEELNDEKSGLLCKVKTLDLDMGNEKSRRLSTEALLTSARENAERLSIEIRDLNIQLKEKLLANGNLQQKLSSLEDHSRKLQTEKDNLSLQFTFDKLQLEQECEKLQLEKEKLSQKLATLEEIHNGLQNELLMSKQELQMLKEESQQRCEALEKTLRSKEIQVRSYSTECSGKDAELVKQEKIIDQLRAQRNAQDVATDQSHKSQEIYDDLKKTLQNKEHELKQYRLQCFEKDDEIVQQERIITELGEQQNAQDLAIEKSKLELSEVVKRNEELLSKIRHLENEIADSSLANENIKQLENDKESLIQIIEHTNEKLLASGDLIKSLEDTVQDYEITISGLKKVVETNLESLTQVRNEKNVLLESQNHDLTDCKKYKEICNKLIAFLRENGIVCNDKDVLENIHHQILGYKETIEHMKTALEKDQQIKMNLQKEIVELKSNVFNAFKDILKKISVILAENSADLENTNPVKESLDYYSTTILRKLDEFLVTKKNLQTNVDQLNKDLGQLKILNAQIIQEKSQLELDIVPQKVDNNKGTVKLEKTGVLAPTAKINLEPTSEEEWKKKHRMLKQKLVLTESDKNKLEKRVKQLREENAKLLQETSSLTNDTQYKLLLQEHIQLKEEYLKLAEERDKLLKSGDNKANVNEMVKLTQDLQNIRDAYGQIMSINSKLELENVSLRKIIEERNSQLNDLSRIKEAYEKLLEENNKLMTEIDTVKYKRTKDKEDFVRLLKKKIEEQQTHQSKTIQAVKAEYDSKLEKMKEKMLHLYREEVNKEIQKFKSAQNSTAGSLKSDLINAEQKIQLLQMERDFLKTKQSIQAETNAYIQEMNRHEPDLFQDSSSAGILPERLSLYTDFRVGTTASSSTRNLIAKTEEDRRASTLPSRSVKPEEFAASSARGSVMPIPSEIGRNLLQMEDEDDDLFNNKYLADLKEGRCPLPTSTAGGGGRESNVSRFSELARRNTLVPPHLKSSYPAETQFATPSRFKDEDIKAGHVEFEDSLCKLLPGEKPARKKDFGTTSYKKPGPPTPSKNGGRLSLQGNEIHPTKADSAGLEAVKSPKRATPSRIRQLFTTKNSSISTKDSTEGQSSTPIKRRSFFRRPK